MRGPSEHTRPPADVAILDQSNGRALEPIWVDVTLMMCTEAAVNISEGMQRTPRSELVSERVQWHGLINVIKTW